MKLFDLHPLIKSKQYKVFALCSVVFIVFVVLMYFGFKSSFIMLQENNQILYNIALIALIIIIVLIGKLIFDFTPNIIIPIGKAAHGETKGLKSTNGFIIDNGESYKTMIEKDHERKM